MSQCWLCRVVGHVQGVWFRASTRDQALQLGLNGQAANLPDGSVQVVACGDPSALTRLRNWLRQGPPMARVDRVDCQRVERPGGQDGFDIA